MAVDYRREKVKYPLVLQGFDDDLIADPIDITMRNANLNLIHI